MQTATVGNLVTLAATTILKSANEEPKLAGELISKTVATMQQIPVAGTPAQPIAARDGSTTGNLINITA